MNTTSVLSGVLLILTGLFLFSVSFFSGETVSFFIGILFSVIIISLGAYMIFNSNKEDKIEEVSIKKKTKKFKSSRKKR